MSLADPFFVVKDEVQKSVQTARGLYSRWCELLDEPTVSSVSKEEYTWTTSELKNSLRSIEWDLEDLDETIGIAEKNPRKFKIDDQELVDRRQFVERMRATIQEMKDHLASPSVKAKEESKNRQALMTSKGGVQQQDRYTRLENEMERDNQRFIDDTQQQQQLIMHTQDDHLGMIGNSVKVLKNMSQNIGNELEEQNRILDDFGHGMESTDSKMDHVMKKMAKVMHMSNDRRQWCIIGVLLVAMVIVIIMFFVL